MARSTLRDSSHKNPHQGAWRHPCPGASFKGGLEALDWDQPAKMMPSSRCLLLARLQIWRKTRHTKHFRLIASLICLRRALSEELCVRLSYLKPLPCDEVRKRRSPSASSDNFRPSLACIGYRLAAARASMAPLGGHRSLRLAVPISQCRSARQQ